MDTTTAIITVIGVLFGGGGITALLMYRGNTTQVLVSAAEGVVVIQSSVIKSLREDLDAARQEISSFRTEVAEARKIHDQVYALQKELNKTTRERDGLKERVSTLETEVKDLHLKLKQHKALG